MKMVCPQRTRLLIDYWDVHRYSESVRDLVEMTGLELNTDSDLLRRRVREAWEASEKAPLALTRHEGSRFVTEATFLTQHPCESRCSSSRMRAALARCWASSTAARSCPVLSCRSVS